MQTLFNDRIIETVQLTPQSIAQQTPTEQSQELLLTFRLLQDRNQTTYSIDLRSIRQYSIGIHGEDAILLSQPADSVVLFERESQWIHELMAANAVGIGAMLLQLFPQ